jgi:hypothetical protein
MGGMLKNIWNFIKMTTEITVIAMIGGMVGAMIGMGITGVILIFIN